MMAFDPIELSKRIELLVCKEDCGEVLRRYYRFRGGRWYGGIATADCVGCNLRCKFCWSWGRGSFTVRSGDFYTSYDVFRRIRNIASRRGYRFVRVSGGEPTLCRKHLIKLLNYFSNTRYIFILETNGILIGYYDDYAKQLSKYRNLVVRVSLKGTSPDEFEYLTGAQSKFFEYQLEAIRKLIEYGMEPGEQVYPAVMLSFSKPDNIRELVRKLYEIDPILPKSIDPEYVILYPHVKKLMDRYGLKPYKAFDPQSIPKYMI